MYNFKLKAAFYGDWFYFMKYWLTPLSFLRINLFYFPLIYNDRTSVRIEITTMTILYEYPTAYCFWTLLDTIHHMTVTIAPNTISRETPSNLNHLQYWHTLIASQNTTRRYLSHDRCHHTWQYGQREIATNLNQSE